MTKSNETSNNAKAEMNSPIDIIKKDFLLNYLPAIMPEIKEKAQFGNPLIKPFPHDVKMPYIKKQIFAYDKNTYKYTIGYDKKGKTFFVSIEKILNADLDKIKSCKIINNNKTVTPSIANIQLLFNLNNGGISEPVVLDNRAKSYHRDFDLAANKSNNGIISNFDDESFLLFMEKINEQAQETILSFTNPGRVNYNNINGRLYSNAYMENGEIISANEYGEVKIGDKLFTLDNTKKMELPKLYTGEYDVKNELYALLKQTEEVYKGKIEPFLCLGAAVMCVYLEEIWDNLAGFPIVYLQGATKQGKSLVQGIISNMYGYTKKQMSTASSTDISILNDCHNFNSIALCINDYDYFQAQSNKFENNVVHLYETGIRKRMKNAFEYNIQPVSSTAIYSSNYMPCVKPKIFNRLLPLYFPENGLDTQYITAKYVNNPKRSKILAEIQKFGWEKVLKLIEGTENFILSFNIFPNKDRESNNVAIAYAGLCLLENISEYKLPNQEELLMEYCQWYQDMIEKTESPVDAFINALPTLFHKKLLKKNINFKIDFIEGRVIFTFDTQTCIMLYNSYFSQEGNFGSRINAKTFAYDLKASKYYIDRTTVSYQGKRQASSTILDITDNANGKCFYYNIIGGVEAVAFSDIPYKKQK